LFFVFNATRAREVNDDVVALFRFTHVARVDGRIDKQTDGWTHGKLPLVAESGWKNPNANVGVWRFTNIGINLSILFQFVVVQSSSLSHRYKCVRFYVMGVLLID